MKEETTLEKLRLFFPNESDEEIEKKTIPAIIQKINQIEEADVFDPVERANALSELYFQLALLYRVEGDKEKSLEAAIKTFEWSVFTFHAHPMLVEILLEQGDEKHDKLAVEIANFHEFYFAIRATEEEESLSRKDEICSLLEQYSATSKEAKWLLEDFSLAPKAAAYFEGNLPISELLKYPKRWRVEGRNPLECDKAETIFLDFANRTRELTSLWKDRDLSTITDVTAFIRVIVTFIKKDISLPSSIEIPKTIKDPLDYYESVEETEEFRQSLKTKEDILPESSPDVVLFGTKLDEINLVLTLLSKRAYELCSDFLEDKQEKRNGYAASYPLINKIVNQYVYLLDDTFQHEEAFDIGSKMLDQIPTCELAFNTCKAAISIGKEKEALDILDNLMIRPLPFGELSDADRSLIMLKSLSIKAKMEEIPKAEKFQLLDSFLRTHKTLLNEVGLSLLDVDQHITHSISLFSSEEENDFYPLLDKIMDELINVCEVLADNYPEDAPILRAVALFATRNKSCDYHGGFVSCGSPQALEKMLKECETYIKEENTDYPLISYPDILVSVGIQLFIESGARDGNIINNSQEENKDLLLAVSAHLFAKGKTFDDVMELFTKAKSLYSTAQRDSSDNLNHTEKYAIPEGMLAHECDYLIGLLHFLNGDYPSALSAFSESIQAINSLGLNTYESIHPFRAMAELATARCCELIEHKKNYKKAIKHYTAALEALPTLVYTQKYYGEFIYSVRTKVEPEEAEKAGEGLFSYIKYRLDRDSEPDLKAEALGYLFEKHEEDLGTLAIKAAMMLKIAGHSTRAKNVVKFMLKQDKNNRKLRGLLNTL